MAQARSMCGRIARVTQKKGTLCRKPRNRGGSPSGVSAPPMLETRKMKKTMTCALRTLSRFALMTGRIMTMEAPVVPTQEARNVPISRRTELTRGVPRSDPETTMPPAMVKSPQSRMMKGI